MRAYLSVRSSLQRPFLCSLAKRQRGGRTMKMWGLSQSRAGTGQRTCASMRGRTSVTWTANSLRWINTRTATQTWAQKREQKILSRAWLWLKKCWTWTTITQARNGWDSPIFNTPKRCTESWPLVAPPPRTSSTGATPLAARRRFPTHFCWGRHSTVRCGLEWEKQFQRKAGLWTTKAMLG